MIKKLILLFLLAVIMTTFINIRSLSAFIGPVAVKFEFSAYLKAPEPEAIPPPPPVPPDAEKDDPVTMKIKELKARGLSDSQIIIELEKMGMFWNPKTNTTWTGINRNLPKHPPQQLQQAYETYQEMFTDYASYRGNYVELLPGMLSVSPGYTYGNWAAVKVQTDLTGDYYVEAGVYRNQDYPWDYWLYAEEWKGAYITTAWLMTVPWDQYIKIQIYVYSAGARIGVWINGNNLFDTDWNGDLTNKVHQIHKATSYTNLFSEDFQGYNVYRTDHKRPGLYMPGAYGVWWNNNIATTWMPDMNTPAREVHTLNPLYVWKYRTWTQNDYIWTNYWAGTMPRQINNYGMIASIPSPTVITAETYYDSNTNLWHGKAYALGLTTLDVTVSVSDLGFTLAPYLTAAGETWNLNDQIASTGWQQAVKITDMRYYQTPNRGNITYTNFKDSDYYSYSQPFRYGYDPGPGGTNIAYNFSNWSNFGP